MKKSIIAALAAMSLAGASAQPAQALEGEGETAVILASLAAIFAVIVVAATSEDDEPVTP